MPGVQSLDKFGRAGIGFSKPIDLPKIVKETQDETFIEGVRAGRRLMS